MKTPTTFTYNEPSGLVTSFTHPKSGGGSNTYSFVWDALGNIQSETMPGKNAVASKTTTQNYTTVGNRFRSTAKFLSLQKMGKEKDEFSFFGIARGRSRYGIRKNGLASRRPNPGCRCADFCRNVRRRCHRRGKSVVC
ncbi:MAG: hypothetical protein H8F28_16905 [Fibrella sp.]|nr:hypothetical protein [Armatimonadota bacterium]